MLHYILSDLLPRWHLHYVLRHDEAFSDTNTYMKTSKARGHSILARPGKGQFLVPRKILQAMMPCRRCLASACGPKRFLLGPRSNSYAGLKVWLGCGWAGPQPLLSAPARRRRRARNRTRTGRRSKPEFFLFHLNK
jgi:hypothetical protein